MGRATDIERTLRPALYLCDVHDGAFIHAYRHWHVYFALETAGDCASLPLHRLSVDSGNLCAGRRGLDDQYDCHSAQGGTGGDNYCVDWCAGIFVLEANEY